MDLKELKGQMLGPEAAKFWAQDDKKIRQDMSAIPGFKDHPEAQDEVISKLRRRATDSGVLKTLADPGKSSQPKPEEVKAPAPRSTADTSKAFLTTPISEQVGMGTLSSHYRKNMEEARRRDPKMMGHPAARGLNAVNEEFLGIMDSLQSPLGLAGLAMGGIGAVAEKGAIGQIMRGGSRLLAGGAGGYQVLSSADEAIEHPSVESISKAAVDVPVGLLGLKYAKSGGPRKPVVEAPPPAIEAPAAVPESTGVPPPPRPTPLEPERPWRGAVEQGKAGSRPFVYSPEEEHGFIGERVAGGEGYVLPGERADVTVKGKTMREPPKPPARPSPASQPHVKAEDQLTLSKEFMGHPAGTRIIYAGQGADKSVMIGFLDAQGNISGASKLPLQNPDFLYNIATPEKTPVKISSAAPPAAAAAAPEAQAQAPTPAPASAAPPPKIPMPKGEGSTVKVIQPKETTPAAPSKLPMPKRESTPVKTIAPKEPQPTPAPTPEPPKHVEELPSDEERNPRFNDVERAMEYAEKRLASGSVPKASELKEQFPISLSEAQEVVRQIREKMPKPPTKAAPAPTVAKAAPLRPPIKSEPPMGPAKPAAAASPTEPPPQEFLDALKRFGLDYDQMSPEHQSQAMEAWKKRQAPAES